MAEQAKTTKKKKDKKNVPHGVVNIRATFNNTLVTITEPNGNVIAWSSAGAQGFKGSKKSTPFAAQIAANDAAHHRFGQRAAGDCATAVGPGRLHADQPRFARQRGPGLDVGCAGAEDRWFRPALRHRAYRRCRGHHHRDRAVHHPPGAGVGHDRGRGIRDHRQERDQYPERQRLAKARKEGSAR